MINIENLSFSYKKTAVFNNISLDFQPGNIYGLLGENGVGKTTLLKIICGLLPAMKGSCRVDGNSSFDHSPEMLQDIAFLTDEMELPKGATPDSYVQLITPFYPNYAYATFLHLMQTLEVDPMRKFSEMSFGQQKKSMIAITLSLGTSYILMDEPTNGLDIPSKAQLRSILSKRCDEHTTIIISTHQVRDVENLIDPIIILAKDKVLLNATVQRITEKLYFDHATEQRPNALYSEPIPGGFINVLPNTDGIESQINIEMLFNAVLRNQETIKQLFSNNQ